MNKSSFLFLVFVALLSSGCETSDSQLIGQGRTPAYVEGFHDGRHSGIKEAGNNFDHYIRDEERFASDKDYQSGWLAGETEGKKLQNQAANIGAAAGAAYSGAAINKELKKQDPEKAAKDTVSDMDTSGLEGLGK